MMDKIFVYGKAPLRLNSVREASSAIGVLLFNCQGEGFCHCFTAYVIRKSNGIGS